jgi:putative membrane protein
MRRRILGMVAAAVSLGAIGCTKPEPSFAIRYPEPSVPPAGAARVVEVLPEPDRAFVHQAASANLAAIRYGELAMARGDTQRIRDLGRELRDSHTALNEHLRDRVRVEYGIILPMARLTPAQGETYGLMSRLSGMAFDQAFIGAVATLQQETNDSFTREAILGRDPGLRQFANLALPILNERARMVQREHQLL